MSLLRRANELVIPTTLKMMVYGQAGMGKSTYALSAPRPMLLDFDNGVKRINDAHLKYVFTLQVQNWAEVLEVLKEDLSGFDTIVIDTIGKMMDCIISYKCGTRAPALKDWNPINAEFSNFMRTISSLNKNIIFVAHRDTRKEGDDTVFIPALREKSYNSIVTELDLLGYIEARSDRGVVKRTITFDPTNRNDGKNTCSLPSIIEIPTVLDDHGHPIANNTAIQDKVINPYLSMLRAKKEESEKYEKVIAEIKEQIELVTDEASVNDFVSNIDSFDHVGSSKAMAAQLLNAKAKALGLKFNKEIKKYEAAA